jgi:cardiolipin synthase
MAIYTLPNLLTFFRILVIPGIVLSLISQSFWGDWVAFSFYLLACVTDFFDGYIARATRQISIIGRFLDPIADKLLISTVLITCVGLGRLTGWHLLPVMLIVCREIFISGLREFLADYQIRMPVNQFGKWKTTSQMLALGFLMVYPSTPISWEIKEIGLLLLWVSTILTVWSGGVYMISALRQTHKAHY